MNWALHLLSLGLSPESNEISHWESDHYNNAMWKHVWMSKGGVEFQGPFSFNFIFFSRRVTYPPEKPQHPSWLFVGHPFPIHLLFRDLNYRLSTARGGEEALGHDKVV